MNIKSIAAIALLALAACTQSPAPAPPPASSIAAPVVAQSAPVSPWTYGEIQDAMTDIRTPYASVESTNTLDLPFPYAGPQHATIELLGRNIASFRIEKGQFMCNPSEPCDIQIRFDDGPVKGYTVNQPSDGSTTVLFIQDDGTFVSGLEHAKRVRIAAEIYQAGIKTLTFDVRGLDSNKAIFKCASYSAIAYFTMVGRQLGDSLAKSMKGRRPSDCTTVIPNDATTHAKCLAQLPVFTKYVMDAYKLPRYHDYDDQTKAEDDFAKKAYVACTQSNGEGYP